MAVTDEAIEKIKGMMIVSGALRPGDRLRRRANSPPTSASPATPCARPSACPSSASPTCGRATDVRSRASTPNSSSKP